MTSLIENITIEHHQFDQEIQGQKDLLFATDKNIVDDCCLENYGLVEKPD